MSVDYREAWQQQFLHCSRSWEKKKEKNSFRRYLRRQQYQESHPITRSMLYPPGLDEEEEGYFSGSLFGRND
jgi:hypothetical protein